jgi:putative addiction module killer protein
VIYKSQSDPLQLMFSDGFHAWLSNLRDNVARVVIARRLERLEMGNAGDVRPVGLGISELRIHYGPGYRVYFQRRGKQIALVLCGGNKRTQASDIKRAIHVAQEWEG